MNTWERAAIVLGVWTLVSVPAGVAIGKLLRTRRELDMVDFDDWLQRAEHSESRGDMEKYDERR